MHFARKFPSCKKCLIEQTYGEIELALRISRWPARVRGMQARVRAKCTVHADIFLIKASSTGIQVNENPQTSVLSMIYFEQAPTRCGGWPFSSLGMTQNMSLRVLTNLPFLPQDNLSTKMANLFIRYRPRAAMQITSYAPENYYRLKPR